MAACQIDDAETSEAELDLLSGVHIIAYVIGTSVK
jgi:hypothetical protein